MKDVIKIEDNGVVVYFKTPIFKCQCFNIMDDGFLYGLVYNDKQYKWKDKKWNKETGKVVGSERSTATYFDLVPVDVGVISESPKVCDGKWNGYYIEANKESENLLLSGGYKNINDIGTCFPYIIINDFEYWAGNEDYCISSMLKPLYIVDGKLSATQYHPDEVAFSASSAFCSDEVCDSDDLSIEEPKAKYTTGKYDCYYLAIGNNGHWYKQGGTFRPIKGNKDIFALLYSRCSYS